MDKNNTYGNVIYTFSDTKTIKEYDINSMKAKETFIDVFNRIRQLEYYLENLKKIYKNLNWYQFKKKKRILKQIKKYKSEINAKMFTLKTFPEYEEIRKQYIAMIKEMYIGE